MQVQKISTYQTYSKNTINANPANECHQSSLSQDSLHKPVKSISFGEGPTDFGAGLVGLLFMTVVLALVIGPCYGKYKNEQDLKEIKKQDEIEYQQRMNRVKRTDRGTSFRIKKSPDSIKLSSTLTKKPRLLRMA